MASQKQTQDQKKKLVRFLLRALVLWASVWNCEGEKHCKSSTVTFCGSLCDPGLLQQGVQTVWLTGETADFRCLAFRAHIKVIMRKEKLLMFSFSFYRIITHEGTRD